MKRIHRDVVAAILAHETLAAWFFSSFLLALTGPFGTYQFFSLGKRLIYWPGIVALAIVLGSLILHVFSRPLAGVSAYLATAVRVAAFTLVFSPMLYVVTKAFGGGEPFQDDPLLRLMGHVAAITCVVDVLFQRYIRAMARRAAPHRPRLFHRLPDVKSVDVVRVTVLDHYVIVVMADGSSHRLLMRFSDAINELEGLQGHCTHRSHWVADAFVASAVKRGTKEVLLLTSGEEVPIGRKYRPGLVSAGLIRDPQEARPLSGQGNGKTTPPGKDCPAAALQERA